MMHPIERGTGITESERYLARLGDKTFLNLWSYPNVFIDKKPDGKGDGKELCDLFVVCGDDIIIFSDKTIGWPAGPDVGLSWKRWFKRAIVKSLHQIRGAERWINQFPDRLFLDRQCTQRLPLALPSRERRRVHGIIVALGAGQACKNYFGEGSGSFLIVPELRGIEAGAGNPFTIGDLDPDGSFVHVLDDATLDVVMGELDTITDLTMYLRKKEAFLRSGHLITAHGEEDLVAYYLKNMNKGNEHDFVKEDGSYFGADEFVSMAGGLYEDFIRNHLYKAKKAADADSYAWDRLIETFTQHILAGTAIVADGQANSLAEHEQAVRYMALEPRFARRNYARGILDVAEKSMDHDRFVRAFIPNEKASDYDTGFFFMTLNPERFLASGSYDEYRKVRSSMLYGYALHYLRRHPHLKRAIGIATEPKKKPGVPSGIFGRSCIGGANGME